MVGGLFLPFTPAGRKVELRAIEAKAMLGLPPYASVDPYAVLEHVPARLLDSSIISSCSDSSQAVLLGDGADQWSGIGYGRIGADGEALILLNPTHHPHRQRVTLMEEIIHVLFDHPKTELELNGSTWQRPYDAAVEKEAYSVGAACIIPYKPLFQSIKDEHRTAEQIAGVFGVSVDYAFFRIKDAGLYRVYVKNCT